MTRMMIPTTSRTPPFTTRSFFFSSRRRHTRCSRDWSSDVCSSDLQGKQKKLSSVFAQDLKFATCLPLFYFRNFFPHKIFWSMALRTWSKKANPKIGKFTMKSKHTFIVMFIEGPQNKSNALVKDGIRQLIFRCFERLGPDEKESIETCFTQGNAFVIGAFPNGVGTKGAKLEIIGTVLFSANKHGIWVNWLAISNKIFSTDAYGKGATNASFCNSHFGKFLLLLAQMRSLAHGWVIDMFLQANLASKAVEFYKRVCFVQMPANNILELPQDWQKIMNQKNVPNFYLKFVSDEVNKKESQRCLEETGFTAGKSEYLHLFHLEGQIPVIWVTENVTDNLDSIISWGVVS